uniref:mitogen-activated protein kinase kinase n=1 Tax=Acrobeloides nanus TaxID=290746 RepID=A0A914DFB5_9BILA
MAQGFFQISITEESKKNADLSQKTKIEMQGRENDGYIEEENSTPEQKCTTNDTQVLLPGPSRVQRPRPTRPFFTKIDITRLEESRRQNLASHSSKISDLVEEDWLAFSEDEKYPFSMDDMAQIKILDHRVSSYYHAPSERKIAIKFFTVRQDEWRNLEKRKREIEINAILKHSKKVVEFYGIARNNGQVLLCMELMDGSLTQLYTMLHRSLGYCPPDLLAYIIVEVLDALIYCDSQVFHENEHKRIAHRDIKPHNILINQKGQVKLADFGEAVFLINNSLTSTFAGTLWYLAPERFDQNEAKDKYRATSSDIWSFAITICEMILGELPYNTKELENTSLSDDFIRYTRVKHCIKSLSPYDIIKRCYDFVLSNENMVDEEKEEYGLILDFLKICFDNRFAEKPYDELKKADLYQKYSEENDYDYVIEGMLNKYG